MISMINLKKLVLEPKVNIKNNIVFFNQNLKKSNDKSNNSYSSSEKVILNFLIAGILLFSALEEIDWNIYSSKKDNNEPITDESIWNIYRIFSFFPLSDFGNNNK